MRGLEWGFAGAAGRAFSDIGRGLWIESTLGDKTNSIFEGRLQLASLN